MALRKAIDSLSDIREKAVEDVRRRLYASDYHVICFSGVSPEMHETTRRVVGDIRERAYDRGYKGLALSTVMVSPGTPFTVFEDGRAVEELANRDPTNGDITLYEGSIRRVMGDHNERILERGGSLVGLGFAVDFALRHEIGHELEGREKGSWSLPETSYASAEEYGESSGEKLAREKAMLLK
jgi:hypothetical protein